MNNPVSMPSTASTHAVPVDSGPNSCLVCLDSMFDRRHVLITACNHRIHDHCLEKWFAVKVEGCPIRTCVICRTPVVPLMREQVPVGWKETNPLVEPEALWAVHTGHQDTLANVLSRDPGVVHQCYQTNLSGELGKKVYLLYIAAMKGNSNMVGQLLDAGAKVNATQDTEGQQNGWPALMVAVQNGHADVVTRLLEAGAGRKAFSVGINSPLYLAVKNGHINIVEQLIDAAAKVNAFNFIERGKFEEVKTTALGKAIITKQPKIVERLLKAGAKPDVSYLMKAVQTGQADVVAQLLNVGDRFDLTKPLFEAVDSGETKIAGLILSSAKNKAEILVNNAVGSVWMRGVDSFEYENMTALMAAVARGHSEIVKLLLEAGAKDNNRRDSSYHLSALDFAARYDRRESMQLLIDYKTPVNPGKNEYDLYTRMTPLHWAATKGHQECVNILIANGADINATCFRYGKRKTVLEVAHPSCRSILLNPEQHIDSHKTKTC